MSTVNVYVNVTAPAPFVDDENVMGPIITFEVLLTNWRPSSP
jgi:hypothetical protein